MLYRILRSRFVQLFTRTFIKWQQDGCLEMGAALSYYALFSLFPIFLVIWGIVAKVGPIIICHNAFGDLLQDLCTSAADPSVALLQFAKNSLPEEAFNIVRQTFLQLQKDSTGASIVGFVILFISASNIFGALDRAVQKMWHTHKKPKDQQNLLSTVLQFIWERILAFTLVLGTAGLMLLSLLSRIAVTVLETLLKRVDLEISFLRIDDLNLISSIQLGGTLLTLTIVLMVLLRTLSPVRIRWRDVLPGAAFTMMLFIALQHLVSNSIISIGSRFQSYGVIGGVMVLMFWIYLTSQIFLLGNAFTYVYVHLFGSWRDRPSTNSIAPSPENS
ncbi:MAG: YihY/virulence factor BrkB family protein [Leptolyngbyaceae bacterium]|nr:YihY/virulence factor BrkB family protein [Leptolyngbyaceae bacterium]